MYASLGLSALVFVVHGLVLYGWEVQRQRMGLGWMGLMAGLNLTGAVVYATRVRYVPCLPFGHLCISFITSSEADNADVNLSGP